MSSVKPLYRQGDDHCCTGGGFVREDLLTGARGRPTLLVWAFTPFIGVEGLRKSTECVKGF